MSLVAPALVISALISVILSSHDIPETRRERHDSLDISTYINKMLKSSFTTQLIYN